MEKIVARYIDISKLDEKSKTLLLSSIPNERLLKASSYQIEKDYLLSLGCSYLLDLLLKERGIKDYQIKYNEYGKPYIENGPYFSLSHSGSISFCVLSSSPIGADVELIKPYKESLLKKIAREDEIRDFFSLWTIKESIMKLKGLGFKLPFLDIKVYENKLDIISLNETYSYFSQIINGYRFSLVQKEISSLDGPKEIFVK